MQRMPEMEDKFGACRISVVTPTLRRPKQTAELLEILSQQKLLPFEVILVDGAPEDERETEQAVMAKVGVLPFKCRYIRHGGGTAIQRNVGIEAASGDFIATIDDDIRPEPEFFQAIIAVFLQDEHKRVGGIAGYITNQFFKQEQTARWQWYRRLRLLTTFEPGRYDFKCGYPINRYMQPPFRGVRTVDSMGAGCTVWRREVFDSGLRFDRFFRDYGVLEDAHFALRAGRKWNLAVCGHARCQHLHSPSGRVNRRRIGYKCVVNYYYVFNDIAGPLTIAQKFRFWRYQCFELVRIAISAVRRCRASDLLELCGRLEGFAAVACGKWNDR